LLLKMVRAATDRSVGFYCVWAFWLVVSVALVRYDLGVLSFCGTIFLGIYTIGLRDKFASETTASAYSVFNENGKAIVGGFTARQLDQQLRGFANENNHDHQDPVKGNVAVAKQQQQNTDTTTTVTGVDATEKLRRRQAAARAAEQRQLQQPT
jgi:hypothetical protein